MWQKRDFIYFFDVCGTNWTRVFGPRFVFEMLRRSGNTVVCSSFKDRVLEKRVTGVPGPTRQFSHIPLLMVDSAESNMQPWESKCQIVTLLSCYCTGSKFECIRLHAAFAIYELFRFLFRPFQLQHAIQALDSKDWCGVNSPTKLTFLRYSRSFSPLMGFISSQSPMTSAPHSSRCMSLMREATMSNKSRTQHSERKMMRWSHLCTPCDRIFLTWEWEIAQRAAWIAWVLSAVQTYMDSTGTGSPNSKLWCSIKKVFK